MKKLPLKDVLIMLAVLLIAGCLDPEGAIGQFFLDPAVKDGVDTAPGFGSMFGPVGTAAGSGLAALYAVGRSYFVSKEATKGEAKMADEAKRLESAFKGVVAGVQKAKEALPPEVKESLKNDLIKHTPDWVREKIDEVKGKSQKYLG